MRPLRSLRCVVVARQGLFSAAPPRRHILYPQLEIAAALLCVLCATRPYQLVTDNMLAITCQAAVFVTLQLALYLRLVQYKTSTDINEASLRRLDESLIGALLSTSRDVERGVGYALIALGTCPLLLCAILSAYETPRAWRSAQKAHNRDAVIKAKRSARRLAANAGNLVSSALGKCGTNPFGSLGGSSGSFPTRGRSHNNTVSGPAAATSLWDLGGTSAGDQPVANRPNASLRPGGRRSVSFSVAGVCPVARGSSDSSNCFTLASIVATRTAVPSGASSFASLLINC